jgi:hypothetical protein
MPKVNFCNHDYNFVEIKEELVWDSDDILNAVEVEVYECDSCGHCEEVESDPNMWAVDFFQ